MGRTNSKPSGEPGVAIGVFEFGSPLWLHPGGDWHFVTVPVEVGDEIAELTAGMRRGFGSVRVKVTVGRTTWRTSVFPDKGKGTFVLPVKQAVRTAERLGDGDDVLVRLSLLDL